MEDECRHATSEYLRSRKRARRQAREENSPPSKIMSFQMEISGTMNEKRKKKTYEGTSFKNLRIQGRKEDLKSIQREKLESCTKNWIPVSLDFSART